MHKCIGLDLNVEKVAQAVGRTQILHTCHARAILCQLYMVPHPLLKICVFLHVVSLLKKEGARLLVHFCWEPCSKWSDFNERKFNGISRTDYDTSFQLFLRLLAMHLGKSASGNSTLWKQMKGR